MNCPALVALALFSSGCGLLGARAPRNFSQDARPIPVDTPALGVSGTTLSGFSLKSGGVVIAYHTTRSFGAVITENNASGSFEILENEKIKWQGHCTSEFDSQKVPSAQYACLLLPSQPGTPALSIALSAMGAERLRGAFVTPKNVWRIEGINTLKVGGYVEHNVGWTLYKNDEKEPGLFVEALQFSRPKLYAAPQRSDEDIRELAPLLLTWIAIPDARTNRDGTDPPLRSTPDAKQLPLPPPLPRKPTAFESHAQQLVELKMLDAARALYARILETR